MINKIADCGILLAILLLMENCGSFEFCSVFVYLQDLDNNILNIDIIELISFGLFIGVGKSAQLGFTYVVTWCHGRTGHLCLF